MRRHRLLGLGGALALILLPLPVAAREACTITGTAGRDVFDEGPYGPGVVICGLAGADRVTKWRVPPSGAVVGMTGSSP